jgi:triacylglycerol lipase
VFALTYGTRPEVDPPGYQPGGLVRMQRSARRLKRFAGRVLRRTGAAKVDIVGHSEGSLMPNWWVKYLGGRRKVDDYIGITPLWDGTNLAGLGSIDQIGQELGFSALTYSALQPYCASCRQFLSSSAFMRKMNAGGVRARGVDYTMLLTRNDELVSPLPAA